MTRITFRYAALAAFIIANLSCSMLSQVSAQTLSWTMKANMPVTGGAGRNMPMSFTIGSKIYAGGGNIAPGGTGSNEFYEYDTATNMWTKLADLPGATDRSAGVAFAVGGKGYVGLGVSGYFGTSATYLSDLWEYNTTTNAWTAKASLPDTGRGGGVACFVVNGKAYVVGGQITPAGLKTDEVYQYDPATNAWTAKAPFPEGPVTYPFAFGSATRGYISSGRQGTVYSKKTYEYDPVGNSWTAKADFPGPGAFGGVAFTLGSKTFCGLDANDTMYAYDQTTNSWSGPLTNFPGTDRSYAVSAVIGNRAYVGCGWSFNSTTSTQVFFQDWYRVFDSTATTSGLTDLDTRNQVSVYPNPAYGILNISLSNSGLATGSVTILNLTGSQIAVTNWRKDNPVDISMLPAGLYIVRLNVGDDIYYSRVAVEK